MDALSSVAGWPVDNAAVAVFRRVDAATPVPLGGNAATLAVPLGGNVARQGSLPRPETRNVFPGAEAEIPGGGAGGQTPSGLVDIVEQVGEPDRGYRLASVSKLMSAYAVLIAVEEGVFALDDPAGPPGATVAHLLAHTSGLGFAGPRVLAGPGVRRIYSNTGFEVLGDVLEQASGIAFADYLAEAVFTPLGMTASELRGSPAYAVWSTLADTTRFAAELLAPTLLAPETVATATSVAFPGLSGVLPGFGVQDPNDWGLGFELRDGKKPHWTGATNSPRTFGHFGRSGTFLWVDPAADVACVGLTDREFGQWASEAWPRLSDGVLAELSSATSTA